MTAGGALKALGFRRVVRDNGGAQVVWLGGDLDVRAVSGSFPWIVTGGERSPILVQQFHLATSTCGWRDSQILVSNLADAVVAVEKVRAWASP